MSDVEEVIDAPPVVEEEVEMSVLDALKEVCVECIISDGVTANVCCL